MKTDAKCRSTIPSQRVLRALLVVCCGWLASLHAAEPSPAAEIQQTTDSTPGEIERNANLKDLEDPTILRRRWWLQNEFDNLDAGEYNNKLTFGYIAAGKMTDNEDWGFRLEVPVVLHNAESSKRSDAFGLGDIDVAAGTIFRLSDTVRTGGAMEMRMNSATHSRLGDDRWRLSPFWGVSWDISKHVRTELLFQFDFSFAEEPGVKLQRTLEVHFPTTFVLPDDWSITVEYKPQVDYAKHEAFENIIRAAISKHLKDRPLAISLSFEQPLNSQPNQFKALLTATYFLK